MRNLSEAFNSAIRQEIENALNDLPPNCRNTRGRFILQRLTGRVATLACGAAEHDYLTVEDVARLLGISEQRVRARVAALNRRGVAVGWKAGKTWLFSSAEVETIRPGLPGRPALVQENK